MAEEYIYKNTVQPSWIDNNNHMHDAQYYSIFSDVVVGFFESDDYMFLIDKHMKLPFLVWRHIFHF